MSIKKGIWRLKIEAVEELSDVDRQYIAKKIKEGYWAGEIIKGRGGLITDE